MTREEFSSAKFGVGMKLYHYACQFAYEIVTVNFEEDLIGADGNIIGTPYEGFEL